MIQSRGLKLPISAAIGDGVETERAETPKARDRGGQRTGGDKGGGCHERGRAKGQSPGNRRATKPVKASPALLSAVLQVANRHESDQATVRMAAIKRREERASQCASSDDDSDDESLLVPTKYTIALQKSLKSETIEHQPENGQTESTHTTHSSTIELHRNPTNTTCRSSNPACNKSVKNVGQIVDGDADDSVDNSEQTEVGTAHGQEGNTKFDEDDEVEMEATQLQVEEERDGETEEQEQELLTQTQSAMTRAIDFEHSENDAVVSQSRIRDARQLHVGQDAGIEKVEVKGIDDNDVETVCEISEGERAMRGSSTE